MAERMNGYIYDGSKSLRTTDGCLKGPLLKSYKHDSKISLEYEMIHAKGNSFVATVDNVLNPEQCKEIITNSKQENFKSMLEKYRYCQRNNSRVLILDDEFSSSFWETLEPAVNAILTENNIPTQPLGFDVSRGSWKLHSLNSGFRINKYTAEEKQFFSAHKDAQYCPNGDRRSLLTVLVFLNEDFEGGFTKFYFPKRSDEEILSKGICKDKTVDEEISNFGGLEEGYKSFTIKPSVGKAVIFSQNILHESTLLEEKTKYILKTDVMVNRQAKTYGFVVSEDEKIDYLQCLNLFREAQSLELAREKEKAGDLYERALSIRYCYPMALKTERNATQNENNNSWDNYVLPGHIWHRIFDCLSGKDIHNFIRAYPEFTFEQLLWEQRRSKNDERESEESPLYIPIVEEQKGIYTRFRFKDDEFFFDNEEACIRVVAMYSLYLLGHKVEDQFYTVRYNPETQEVCGVTLKSLLKDVFLNRPCYGAVYAVMQQDPNSKNIAKDFEASVDRSYMTMRHGAQFVGGAIGDEMKVRVRLRYLSTENIFETDFPEEDVSEEDLAKMIEETERERKRNKDKQQLSHSNYLVLPNNERYVKFKKKSDLVAARNTLLPPRIENISVEKFAKVLEAIPDEQKKEELRSYFSWRRFGRYSRFSTLNEKNLNEFRAIEGMKDSLNERLLDGCTYIDWGDYCALQRSIPADIRSMFYGEWQKNCKYAYRNQGEYYTAVGESDYHTSGDSSAKDLYMSDMIDVCSRTPGVSAAIVSKVWPPAEDEERPFICSTCELKRDGKLCYNHLVFDFTTHQLVVTKFEESPNEITPYPPDESSCLYKSVFKPDDFDKALDHYKVDISPILDDGIGFNHAGCTCTIMMEECNLIDFYPELNHIHVLRSGLVEPNEIVFWTLYGGIVAL
eukprot:Seg837.4 transcript_id=Seg837.4/GoldUCD/mRNA.D3Y31 product="hypothetical protein" protein_id=Seg837.4/GoldUCD/D3Y31